MEKKQENPLINLGINILLPSLILTKFSKPEYLGQVLGLTIAVALPLGYGLYELIIHKRKNIFSLIGLLSVVLTGGIGLFSLDKKWMIVKETSIPLIMGIAIFISQYTKKPIVNMFFAQMLDIEKIDNEFKINGVEDGFFPILKQSSWMLGLTFFLSAFLNYYLAVEILKGNPGTVEFNESLGKMTALSFPVISVPMMIMLAFILFYIFYKIKKVTNLEIESVLKNQLK